MTNDVQTQANVGLARWFVNKLRSASQMANATPDVPSQSLKTGSRGCAAPLTKEEVAQNQAEIQQNNADPTAFVNKDVYDLATGDISEKTTAALNLVELGLTFTAPAGRLGGGQQFVRDMGLGNRMPTGSLTIQAGTFSQSEVAAANYMSKLGNNVLLRAPIGTRAGGGTSDLLVNGIKYDVYTPISNNPNAIISAMAKKNSQTTGIVLDLSKTTVTAGQLGDALKRVNNAGAKNIKDIKIMPKNQ